MEGQGGPPPQGGPGFPRGFPPTPEGHQPDEFFGRPPPFVEEGGRGRGGTNNRGMRGRIFQSRQSDRRREDQDRSEVKRSRWSNASPQPQDDNNQSSVPKVESSPEVAKPSITIKSEQNVSENSEVNKDMTAPVKEEPSASLEEHTIKSEPQDTIEQSVHDNSMSDVAPVISPKSERWSSLSAFTAVPEKRSSTEERLPSKEQERRSSLSGLENKTFANEPERRSSFSGPVDIAVSGFHPEPMEQDISLKQEKEDKHFESSMYESSSIEQVNENPDKNKGIDSSNNAENKADSSETFEPSISSEQV